MYNNTSVKLGGPSNPLTKHTKLHLITNLLTYVGIPAMEA
jgi:hypothetical protein